jgi:hypothetical protein
MKTGDRWADLLHAGTICVLALFLAVEGRATDVYYDTGFVQEYHVPYQLPGAAQSNDVRAVELDTRGAVWAATANGVDRKTTESEAWLPVGNAHMHGPSYDLLAAEGGGIWAGTWNGLWFVDGEKIRKIEGVHPPVSVLCRSSNGIYAMGPEGIWHVDGEDTERMAFETASSVRDAMTDDDGRVWIATDVGLFIGGEEDTRWYKGNGDFISAYLSSIAAKDGGEIWIGGLGGVTVWQNGAKRREISVEEGIPSAEVRCIAKAPDGSMWVGTRVGVVRYYEDGSHSLRFGRRWLLHNEVRDVAFDASGNAWVATAGGVSAIMKKRMTLSSKEKYFYNVLMTRHIRDPWIAGQCRLEVAGDTSTWRPEDDDNDGEYTGFYLAMESLRYAETGDPDALEKARRAFDFLVKLQEVTGTEGFFARTIVPIQWEHMHDMNRTYSEVERAEELVKNPRYKPVEERWRKSSDGKWWWKGDTSSDEMVGHMLGYFYFYEFAAKEEDKRRIKDHVCRIMDYVISNDYNFIDVDGSHTRWAVWSPDDLNRNPDWAPERNLNSFEVLSFLKFAHHVSGKKKYQDEYLRLIRDEGYLENASRIPQQNPAWFIYFDLALAAYVYPILLFYEEDPALHTFYKAHIDQWYTQNTSYRSPLFNFIYCLARDEDKGLRASVDFLVNTPLDLVDWPIDHTIREDVRIVRHPVLEELQVEGFVPVDLRGTVRWDKNPYAARTGNPYREREPVFWLFPYWLGRYLGLIQ